MSRIGLDSCCYRLHLEDLDHPRDAHWLVQKTLDLGLAGCSFNSKHLRGWDEHLIRAVGMACNQNGLYLELSTSGSDYSRLTRRLILASEVGARALRTSLSESQYGGSEDQKRVLLQFAIDNLKRLADVAECVGIVIAIGANAALTYTELIEVIECVDSRFVRACFCNAEAPRAWKDSVQSAVALAPYLSAVLLGDWKCTSEEGKSTYQGCALGEGHARVGDIYRTVLQSCPTVPITLHLAALGPGFHGLEDEESLVCRSLAYLRTLDTKPQLIG